MKRARALVATLLLAIVLSLSLVACSSNNEPASNGGSENSGTETTKLIVGAAQVPHAEILEFIKPTLLEQGVEIEIIVPTDESALNQQTDSGEIDVNYMQHKPYLDSVVAEKKFDLVSIGGIHIEPIGAYSDKYTSVADLPDNAVVAVPYEGTNEYRALVILEEEGLIKLKADIDPVTASKNDIESYLKPLDIQELEPGLIVQSHDQFDLYITNTNRVIEYGLDPTKFLFREGTDSIYSNIIVVKSDRANDPAVKILYNTLRSPEVKQFIDDKYNGAVVAAF